MDYSSRPNPSVWILTAGMVLISLTNATELGLIIARGKAAGYLGELSDEQTALLFQDGKLPPETSDKYTRPELSDEDKAAMAEAAERRAEFIRRLSRRPAFGVTPNRDGAPFGRPFGGRGTGRGFPPPKDSPAK